MCTSRRHFVAGMAAGGVSVALASSLPIRSAFGSGPGTQSVPYATGERMAGQVSNRWKGYYSQTTKIADQDSWAQIDLGSILSFDALKLFPTAEQYTSGDGFPVRFRIECSDSADFSHKTVLADCSRSDFPDPHDHILQFPARQARGRYVRLTATLLRRKQLPADIFSLMEDSEKQALREELNFYWLGLAKIEVLSRGRDLAVGCGVTVDPLLGNQADARQLTRPARPAGEGIVTDNPRNVSHLNSWRPVAYKARSPLGGVEIGPGVFRAAMLSNIRYLLDSFTDDEMLHQFRQRAGRPVPAVTRRPDPFWEQDLAGSCAGRFLMGAGNTLRWIEDPELRRRMREIVKGIAECREPDGYIMAFPRDSFFVSERAAYTRSWLTQGLIEAGYAGETEAFSLLRGYYDGYNALPYLSLALRACNQGGQGMVANSRLYFTPVGKAADLQVLQRYFEEDYWLAALAERRPDALWQYPYEYPHAFLLTNIEAYLDLYRATGEVKYLDAVLGAWELFRENWQNTGGSISLIEVVDCPPKSNSLLARLGETCGSAFWVLLNHRLHLLDPDNERYMAEIEKSIWNVLLANHAGAEGVRYHSMLIQSKEVPTREGSCCEGQGTRIIGALPQFIYSTAEDGVYINLYQSSGLSWQGAGGSIELQMETAFPANGEVRVTLHADHPVRAKLRIRVPSWTATPVTVAVNGEHAVTGTSGSYLVLERTWASGDEISFNLPMSLRQTKYLGVDQIQGSERYAIEYGPLLMAALDTNGAALAIHHYGSAAVPADFVGLLHPIENEPTHFSLREQMSSARFIPYFEVNHESLHVLSRHYEGDTFILSATVERTSPDRRLPTVA